MLELEEMNNRIR
jgi:hypothetical protein